MSARVAKIHISQSCYITHISFRCDSTVFDAQWRKSYAISLGFRADAHDYPRYRRTDFRYAISQYQALLSRRSFREAPDARKATTTGIGYILVAARFFTGFQQILPGSLGSARWRFRDGISRASVLFHIVMIT